MSALRPPSGDAARLLWLVRHLQPADLAQTLHTGLSDAQLLGAVAALPAQRRDSLLERARQASVPPPAPGRWAPLERRPGRPLAVALRQARGRAGMSQGELAAAVLGVCQSAVSQWECGVREPSGRRLAVLLRVLPSLADLLAPPGCGQPAGTRAS